MTRTRNRLAVAAAVATAVAAIVITGAAGVSAHGSGSNNRFSAHLTGFQEVPALNSRGDADLEAEVTHDKITFELKFAGLTGNPLFAHIHVGQRGVNGGVAVFFCGGGGKPACPSSTSGTVTG